MGRASSRCPRAASAAPPSAHPAVPQRSSEPEGTLQPLLLTPSPHPTPFRLQEWADAARQCALVAAASHPPSPSLPPTLAPPFCSWLCRWVSGVLLLWGWCCRDADTHICKQFSEAAHRALQRAQMHVQPNSAAGRKLALACSSGASAWPPENEQERTL